jgi:SAM-dependent methyltransferase
MESTDASEELARDRARNFGTRFDGQQHLEDYKGIPIFAAPGLHQLALERLREVLPATQQVAALELGAGGGAMSLRLSDAGYQVTASDLFRTNFTPSHIPFHELDLNRAFADQVPQKFDVLVALELIEHLENPRHFFRESKRMLKRDGYLVLSTPNIVNPASLALLIRSGEFQWFQDQDYHQQGHIMPLSPVVLRRCWEESGFGLLWEGSVSKPLRMFHGKNNKTLRWLARIIDKISNAPTHLRGEVYLAVLKLT